MFNRQNILWYIITFGYRILTLLIGCSELRTLKER
nr:MAG TPA: hypothetical protein [Caudoviricetes sp.]